MDKKEIHVCEMCGGKIPVKYRRLTFSQPFLVTYQLTEAVGFQSTYIAVYHCFNR